MKQFGECRVSLQSGPASVLDYQGNTTHHHPATEKIISTIVSHFLDNILGFLLGQTLPELRVTGEGFI